MVFGRLAHAPELVKGVAEAYEGITTEAFERGGTERSVRHAPTLGVPYADTAYRPMRELIGTARGERLSRLHLLGGRPRLRTCW